MVWSVYAFQVHISPTFALLCFFVQGSDVTANIHWDAKHLCGVRGDQSKEHERTLFSFVAFALSSVLHACRADFMWTHLAFLACTDHKWMSPLCTPTYRLSEVGGALASENLFANLHKQYWSCIEAVSKLYQMCCPWRRLQTWTWCCMICMWLNHTIYQNMSIFCNLCKPHSQLKVCCHWLCNQRPSYLSLTSNLLVSGGTGTELYFRTLRPAECSANSQASPFKTVLVCYNMLPMFDFQTDGLSKWKISRCQNGSKRQNSMKQQVPMPISSRQEHGIHFCLHGAGLGHHTGHGRTNMSNQKCRRRHCHVMSCAQNDIRLQPQLSCTPTKFNWNELGDTKATWNWHNLQWSNIVKWCEFYDWTD